MKGIIAVFILLHVLSYSITPDFSWSKTKSMSVNDPIAVSNVHNFETANRTSFQSSPVMKSQSIKTLAEQLIGIPYNTKGNSPEKGFNTATLVQYLYREGEGILLSRKAILQRELGEVVTLKNLQLGDLLFFQIEDRDLSAIYLENGEFIVATKTGVALRNLFADPYWKKHFVEAKRLTPLEKEKLNPSSYISHDHTPIREAIRVLHRPYLLTGNTLAAFDCSFLVQHTYKKMDIHLPRITYNQWEVGKDIPLEEAIPGDVLYFSGTWQEGISHTGIYLGDNFFIHASSEEGETTISYLGEYWKKYLTGVKRFNHLQVNSDNTKVQRAYELLNISYKENGASPDEGFNYSGLIHYIFKHKDKKFPRTAKAQWEYGSPVPKGEEKEGDVFFFRSNNGSLLPALYIGQDRIIVVRKDKGVSIVYPEFSYYWTKDRLAGIRRY
ncbi:cell wall-associated NlpC family hydrolase [Evansella vedderi]|uniref:Cell wall-associated NlpC family hydrolase n=1 Tax=Evansella vedderi TaxID=38282 RepID=A0ABU0A0H3_9BACI|nr:NlpC/P60 family protein [Evansella vedderi]MDQ0255835.1 cell wall-associated NlpC family hydrolase [Evansella vedderi]